MRTRLLSLLVLVAVCLGSLGVSCEQSPAEMRLECRQALDRFKRINLNNPHVSFTDPVFNDVVAVADKHMTNAEPVCRELVVVGRDLRAARTTKAPQKGKRRLTEKEREALLNALATQEP